MRRTLLMLLALVAVATVMLAACGGSSSKSSSGGSSASGPAVSGNSGSFCDLLKHDINDKALNGNPTNVADAKKQVQALKTAFDQLAHAAPSPVKSDMQTLQSFYKDLANSVMSATGKQDFTSKAQAVQSKHKAVNGSQQKLSAYAKQRCGISSGSGG